MTGKRLPASPSGPIFDPITGKRLVKRQRAQWVTPVAALVVLVVLAGAVVGGLYWKDRRDDQAAADARADKRAEVAKVEDARVEACKEELDPLYDALVAVDGRMDTGANISQFGDIVGTASSVNNAVDEGVVGANDCALADPLGQIVLMYGAVYSGWNDCIFGDSDCDTDSDIDVGTALSEVSYNLGTLGSDMSLTEDPSEFDADLAKIVTLVTCDYC